MAFQIDQKAIKDESSLGGSPFMVTKSDTVPCVGDNGCYPRGYYFGTGGTLTVWVDDPATPGYTKKRDLGSIPDGFIYTWGGIFGIAATDEAGDATTCAAIMALP